MRELYLQILLFFIFLLCGCAKESSCEFALKQSGANRVELEKVLSRYSQNKADSLKYKATCFLIENMENKYYYEGEQLDSCLTYFRDLKFIENKSPDEILRNSIAQHGYFHINEVQKKYDIKTIDSTYLCENIDLAFEVWKNRPWNESTSFDDFCEMILPYRIGDEKLVGWREYYLEKYSPLLDSISKEGHTDMTDVVDVVKALRRLLDKNIVFTTVAPDNLPHVGPYVTEYLTGSCKELTDHMVYICRALGIPCSIDFTLLWLRVNNGHSWISFHDKKGNLYMQDFPNDINSVRRSEYKTKVYRSTFSINRDLQKKMSQLSSEIYPFYEDPCFKDVTVYYSDCFTDNLRIPKDKLFFNSSKSKIAYLCQPKGMNWEPVEWAEFDENNLTFKNIQKGEVALVATYEKGKIVALTQPFLINCPSGELSFFGVNDECEDITLFSKFSLKDDQMFIGRMVGGVFEGSNSLDFKYKDTLFLIKEKPYRLKTVANILSPKEYRYVRYYGPPYSNCNIAEVSFYTKDSTNNLRHLKGDIIGTPGSFQNNGKEYTNVFDGKTTTSFDYKDGSGGWAGLDLGIPQKIESIVYTPRNRDNYIRPEDTYELFYYKGEWQSEGIIKSSSDSLLYKNIPKGGLLYLKNHTRGNQERIFTIEDGQIIWW